MTAHSIRRRKHVKIQTKIKYSRGDKIFNIIGYIIFTILGLVCVYPFYYLLIATISDSRLVQIGQITLFPRGINFENYIQVFKLNNLLNATKISVLRTFIGTFLSITVTTYTAYFFTKEKMWHRKFWYRMTVATMYFSAGLIPVYLNNKMLHLLNTFWIYVIPGMLGVYNMILVKTSIESMPAELEESAYLDGAGYFKRLTAIVIPLQKPIIATIALFCAVGHWNDFFTTKLNVTNPRLFTLQFQLYELLNQVNAYSQSVDPMMDSQQAFTVSTAGLRMTLTAVVTIPILLVYPFIQRYYVKGIMVGAIKG